MIQVLAKSIKQHPLGRPSFDRKSLEGNTGFLNHLAMTFEDINPIIKGVLLNPQLMEIQEGLSGLENDGQNVDAMLDSQVGEFTRLSPSRVS